MKARFSIIFLCVASALCMIQQKADAQQDFHVTVDTNPYLTYSNAAALRSFSFGKVSVAEISGIKENGGLKSVAGSDDDAEAMVGTESFARVSDHLAFHGKLAYLYYSGKNMGGSILMDPGYNPVNFLESSMDNLGTKNREKYFLTGDLAYIFNERWSVGAGFNYESADQVKVKDPRFYSKWMDLKVAPALYFSPSQKLSLGLSLQYRNTLEKIVGGIYGTTDKQYFILTDKGNFLGTLEELSGDYNYMPANTARPMSNAFYGGSVQISMEDHVRFYNELTFLVRDGYYGKKSSTTATFFEFGGLVASYDGSLMFPSGDNLHKIGLSASYETLGNDENHFRYVTPLGQNTVVEYYSQEHIFDRTSVNASLSYDGWLDVSGAYPSMTFGASATIQYIDSRTVVYPLYRNHDHFTVDANAYAEKSFFGNDGYFTLGGSTSFMTGSGTLAEDGELASVSSTTLRSFDDYMNMQYEYDTASRVSAALSFKYTRRIKAGMSAYVKLSDCFTFLLSQPEYLDGRMRNSARITVGCSF